MQKAKKFVLTIEGGRVGTAAFMLLTMPLVLALVTDSPIEAFTPLFPCHFMKEMCIRLCSNPQQPLSLRSACTPYYVLRLNESAKGKQNYSTKRHAGNPGIGKRSTDHELPTLLEQEYERFLGLQKSGFSLIGTIVSVKPDGNVVVQLKEKVSNNVPVLSYFAISDVSFGKTLAKSTAKFTVRDVQMIQDKSLIVKLKPPEYITSNEEVYSLYKQVILQDSSKARLLDWTKRYSVHVLKMMDSVAIVKIASTGLLGFILKRELPPYILENSTVLARVNRLSPISSANLPRNMNISLIIEESQSPSLKNFNFILMTAAPHAEVVKVNDGFAKSMSRKPASEVLFDAKYKREMKNELLEDELLDLLGSHYYKKLQREREKKQLTRTYSIDDELIDEDGKQLIQIEDYLLDPVKRRELTSEMVMEYYSGLKANLDILKKLDFEELLKRILHVKQHLALRTIEPSSKFYKLKCVLNGISLIDKKTIENMRGLTDDAKKKLVELFVNVKAPAEILMKLIEEAKSNMPFDKRKLFEKELSKQQVLIEPPTYEEAMRLQREGRRFRNKTSVNVKGTTEMDQARLVRVKKYETILRTALRTSKKPIIQHDTSEYVYAKNERKNTTMDSLSFPGDASNTVRIPILKKQR